VNAVFLCVSAYLCFFLVGTFVTDFGKNVKKIAEAEMEKTMAALHLWSKGGSICMRFCLQPLLPLSPSMLCMHAFSQSAFMHACPSLSLWLWMRVCI